MRKQLETSDLRKSSYVALFSFLSLRLGYQFISSLVATRGQTVNALSEGRWCGHCALPDVSRIAISKSWGHRAWFPGATLPSSRSVKLACVLEKRTGLSYLPRWMDIFCRIGFYASFSGLFARNNSRGGCRLSIQDDTRGGEEKSLIDRCSLATIFS